MPLIPIVLMEVMRGAIQESAVRRIYSKTLNFLVMTLMIAQTAGLEL